MLPRLQGQPMASAGGYLDGNGGAAAQSHPPGLQPGTAADALRGIQKNDINGIPHAEPMHRGAGRNPQPLIGVEARTSER